MRHVAGCAKHERDRSNTMGRNRIARYLCARAWPPDYLAAAMMTEGRLVWSRNTHTGAWYVYSFDDANIYVATKLDERWKVGYFSRYPLAARITVTLSDQCLKLADAKRIADEHHHQYILDSGDLNAIEYITRFPLPKEVAV